MIVDGIPAKGSIDVAVQLSYKSNELKSYLKRLYDQNEVGAVDLNINCEDIKKIFSDYQESNGSIKIVQRSNKTAANDRQWVLSKAFFEYIPFKHGHIDCKIIVDDIFSDARFRVLPRLSYKPNRKLQDYLANNIGKDVDIELKIDSFDFDNFIINYCVVN